MIYEDISPISLHPCHLLEVYLFFNLLHMLYEDGFNAMRHSLPVKLKAL